MSASEPGSERPSERGLEAALASVPSTRRAILVALKRGGPTRAHDLADRLGVTVAAIRQQLGRLREDGLIAHRQDATGRGRPAFVYELTPVAESLFPKRYGDLTTELLSYLGGPSSPEVDHLFEQRRRRRLHAARPRLASMTLEGQVAELTRILDEDGYLADVERLDDGTWRIVEHNCAILNVALRYGQACSSEIGFLREVMPDAQIDRVSHMASGEHHCSYRVRPKPAETTSKGAS